MSDCSNFERMESIPFLYKILGSVANTTGSTEILKVIDKFKGTIDKACALAMKIP